MAWNKNQMQCLFYNFRIKTSNCNIKINFLTSHFISEYEYCFTSPSAPSWQYRDRGSPKPGLCPTLISNDFKSSVYAQRRWQISVPTGIRTWYPQVTSPSRYGWAIGACPHFIRVWRILIRCAIKVKKNSYLKKSESRSWDESHETALLTEDSKLKPLWSEAEHTTSRSRSAQLNTKYLHVHRIVFLTWIPKRRTRSNYKLEMNKNTFTFKKFAFHAHILRYPDVAGNKNHV